MYIMLTGYGLLYSVTQAIGDLVSAILVMCVIYTFVYRRHYCPVHRATVSFAMLPDVDHDNRPSHSHYKENYKQWKDQQRRGLKIPPTHLLPYIPSTNAPLTSTHHADYKAFPDHVPPKGFKPIEVPSPFEFPQETETSYRLDYPEKPLPSLLHIADKPVINVVSGPLSTSTTHKNHFKNWGYQRRFAILQPISMVPKRGKFEQLSTFKTDFTDKVMEGRPSTKQKKPEKLVHDPTQKTDDATTHKETFRRDILPKQMPHLRLRTQSIKNVESMCLPFGPFADNTHYMDTFKPVIGERRGLIVPLDNSRMPVNQKMESCTLYDASYNDKGHVVPGKSYRPVEPYLPVQTKFVYTTSYHEDFRRVPANKQIELAVNVDNIAADVAATYKDSSHVITKHSNPTMVSSNKNDYKRYTVKPHIRQGDFHELPYTPGDDAFNTSTTCQADYKQFNVRPAASCKPQEQPVKVTNVPLDDNTTYQDYFVPKPLQTFHKCPVEQLIIKHT